MFGTVTAPYCDENLVTRSISTLGRVAVCREHVFSKLGRGAVQDHLPAGMPALLPAAEERACCRD
jgi:hypothetical protein